MKRILLYLAALLLSVVATAHWVNERRTASHPQAMAAQAELWAQEKAKLEAALKKARSEPRTTTTLSAPETGAPALSVLPLTPAELIQRLIAVDAAAAAQPRTARRLIHDLEELIAA